MSSANSPHVVRWGILSTGGIATTFAKDLMTNPAERGVSDVLHKIVAVGSRSVESAQAFIDKIKSAETPSDWGSKQGHIDGCKPYGTYEELYSDPNVDAIYIGTPHNYHFQNTRDALNAGKNVLCEKPFTFDLAELDELIALAKSKNLFLMEAVWTRFHPNGYAVQKELASGRLGKPKRFQADFSMDSHLATADHKGRLLNPDLAGGSLLDMGPYPSVWAMMCLHHHPLNKGKAPLFLTSYQTVFKPTGVDQNSRWLLEWENLDTQALLLTDLGTQGFKPATAVLQCEEGDLAIHWPPYRSEGYTIYPHPPGREGKIKKVEEHSHPIQGGQGMHYEADEVARCLAKGLKESPRMPWEESRIVQGWFDRVRKDGQTVHKDWKGEAKA